jgi:hypothetical protein
MHLFEINGRKLLYVDCVFVIVLGNLSYAFLIPKPFPVLEYGRLR